jgi:phospholipid/cholesterol/gamma-HCH transport system ATP-binding protein
MDTDGGQIFFDDVPIQSPKDFARVRRQVGMLFQGGALFDSLTVGENIAYPILERESVSYRKIRARISEKLSMVGLEGIEDLKPSEISGGMQKRVALARAIATEPDVILYDEPTTGLDPSNANRINHLIKHLQRVLGVTSIVVTHDMESAFTVSDRIALLMDRRIVLVDTVQAVRTSADPRVAAFIEGRFEAEP